MKSDDVWRIHRVVEIAIDGVFDHQAQFFDGFSLSMDSVSQGRGDVTSVNLVLLHLEDDLTHIPNLKYFDDQDKSRGGSRVGFSGNPDNSTWLEGEKRLKNLGNQWPDILKNPLLRLPKRREPEPFSQWENPQEIHQSCSRLQGNQIKHGK